jgi:CRISPR/Cas system-associated exonuclease Cas4 (RecB family)
MSGCLKMSEHRSKLVERRLAQKYAQLPPDHVAVVVQHAYERFSQSTVRDFIPLLVERRVDEELARLTTDHAAVAIADRAAAGRGTVDIRHLRSGDGAWWRAPARWRLTPSREFS